MMGCIGVIVMSHTQLMRVDDPIDERQRDIANELADRHNVIAVSPVPNGSKVRVYHEGRTVRTIFRVARKNGYIATEQSTEPAEDARSRIRAFTGRWENFEAESLDYVELTPADVPEFDCDWCEEHIRGERASSRYKPEDQQTEGYPKDMWTLCKDCDPEFTDGEHTPEAAEDHPRIGNAA